MNYKKSSAFTTTVSEYLGSASSHGQRSTKKLMFKPGTKQLWEVLVSKSATIIRAKGQIAVVPLVTPFMMVQDLEGVAELFQEEEDDESA